MLRKRGLKKSLKENKEGEERVDLRPVATTKGVEHVGSSTMKETTMEAHADEDSESQRTSMHSSNGTENENMLPPAQQGNVTQNEELSGWPKSWTDRVEAVRLHRFDLEGNLVAMDEAPIRSSSDTALDLRLPTVQDIAERDSLRSEGDPAAMGYTLKEAADLVRSTVPGHRTFALRLIASVLQNAVIGLQEQKITSSLEINRRTLKDVDWQAIWAYALGPEPGLTLTLRLALDDTHTTVIVSCAKALQALLSCSANNAIFDLYENCWPRMNLVYTAPVFRRHTKQDEGFIGGGRWKYNVKASELYPFVKTASSQEDIINRTPFIMTKGPRQKNHIYLQLSSTSVQVQSIRSSYASQPCS